MFRMSEEASSSGVAKEVKETDVGVEDDVEEDDEQGVTMLDVLEEEQDLESDANAVLGGSDDQNCTYSRGYVPRQALYTCTTCLPVTAGEDFKPAGVCLACSYNCHEGHELVELYTKRNFKCDCGNSKFGDNKCTLEPEKDAENEDNQYNQNFRGVYCSCERPYPDPEDKVEDEMLQCILCEDWFHGRHLDLPAMTPITSAHNFSEVICGGCMEKNDFLWHYVDEFAVSGELANVSIDVSMEEEKNKGKAAAVGADAKPEAKLEAKPEATEKLGDSENTSGTAEKAGGEDKQAPVASEAGPEKAAEPTPTTETPKAEASADKSAASDTPPAENGDEKPVECYLKGKTEALPEKRATFWPGGWRKQLCSCQECRALYAGRGLQFLTEEDDMVQAYEEAGKQKLAASGSQYEQGMRALSGLDRVRQVEAIGEYNQMKVELKDFLAKFAATKRVVREEDIQEFFTELKAKRRRTDSIPHFCH